MQARLEIVNSKKEVFCIYEPSKNVISVFESCDLVSIAK